MESSRRRELRALNTRVWAGEQGLFVVNSSLDSSLKKNTAFIKRLRTGVNATALNTILQEIRTLSLHKYLSEIIAACYEGLCKLKLPGEVIAGVETVSALHQRFGTTDFTSSLGWLLGRGLTTPDKSRLKGLSIEAKEKEERERLARQKVLLKVVTELWLVGVLRSLNDVQRPDEAARGKENLSKGTDSVAKGRSGHGAQEKDGDAGAEPFPLEALKNLLSHDREHVNLPLVVVFVRSFSWDVLGVQKSPTEGQKVVTEDEITTATPDTEELGSWDEDAADGVVVNNAPMTEPALQQLFRNILSRYFEDVRDHLVRDQKALMAEARRNAEAYVKSGEIFEDRQANYERHVKAREKLVRDAQVLADTLGLEMPEMRDGNDAAQVGEGGISMIKTGEYLRGQGEAMGIWEDEEERRFYENLIDLKDRVPSILLEDGKKKKADGDDQLGKRAEINAQIVQDAKDGAKGVTKTELDQSTKDPNANEADDLSTAIANKTVGAQVDAVISRLPELSNKDMIDQAAIDFCFLNSKASRNRLIKAVQEVPKGRSDLLPIYSRLVATLGKYMLDVTQGLVNHLDAEFRSLQRRKDKDFLGRVRTSNIRYLAELTKFGVVPEHTIFHCLKVSTDDFSRMNIEIICNLLENCGRYLLRNPETSPRMQQFLEILQRKKNAQHLGQQERMLIENAVYYVDPPARAAIQQKERSPVELFVRKLLYLDMNKRNYSKILRQIRKLHWEEPEVVHVLTKIFSKPGKVKHSNIHLLAALAGSLYRYHQGFVISIIDNIVEHITVGLEQNDFRFNQRRISEVKYLGELYNYKMVDSPVIFDTLYRIVTFGHEGGTPRPSTFCVLDMPDDYFRIRLVCVLLETCGLCFDRGIAQKKLNFFLNFFQYYIYTKETLPMEVDFLIQDTLSLIRPAWKLASSLDEASRIFAEAVALNYQSQDAEKTVEPDESEDEPSSEDGAEDDEVRVRGIDADALSSGDEVDVKSGDEHPESTADESGDEDIVVTLQESERDPEADADFDRELAKLMADSVDSRKLDRKQMFDVPLPMRRHNRDASHAAAAPENGPDSGPMEPDAAPRPTETMAFSLLTKRGNRQQTRTVELPSDSNFAVAMKTQQQAEREEQQRIKNLVLKYDLRDDETQDQDNSYGPSNSAHATKMDKAGATRNKQRTRKLQLSDVDW